MTESFSTKSCRPLSSPKHIHIPMPDDMKKLMHELENKGHTCIMYCGLFQPKLTWCLKEVCTRKDDLDKMFKHHKEQLELLEKLKKEGHTCAMTPESMPAQVSWCKQDVCIRKKDNEI
jgi:hypothetical protein